MLVETYDLFSHEFPQRNLGMIDHKATTLEVDVAGERYDIRQSLGLLTSSNSEGTTGAALWKISPLLAEWLADPTSPLWSTGILYPDAVVVELGCGITGLVGLVMAKRVSSYILTDQKSVLKLLQGNVEANGPQANNSNVRSRSSRKAEGSSEGNVDSKARVIELNWESDDAAVLDEALGSGKQIDLVIVCDCVFNDFLLQPLVTICENICSRSIEKKTALLVAQQLRSDEVFSAFMELLLTHFHVWRLSNASLPPTLQSGSGFAVHLAILR